MPAPPSSVPVLLPQSVLIELHQQLCCVRSEEHVTWNPTDLNGKNKSSPLCLQGATSSVSPLCPRPCVHWSQDTGCSSPCCSSSPLVQPKPSLKARVPAATSFTVARIPLLFDFACWRFLQHLLGPLSAHMLQVRVMGAFEVFSL